jgi:hypothetical protein
MWLPLCHFGSLYEFISHRRIMASKTLLLFNKVGKFILGGVIKMKLKTNLTIVSGLLLISLSGCNSGGSASNNANQGSTTGSGVSVSNVAEVITSNQTTAQSTSNLVSNALSADNGDSHQYWALHFPQGGNTTVPLYVYKESELVAYVEAFSQPVFLGKYNSSDSDGEYQIVIPEGDSSYVGCSFSLSGKQFSSSTCTGMVANTNGNQHVLTYAAVTLPNVTPNPVPQPPVYESRTITIRNNTSAQITVTPTNCASLSSQVIASESQYVYSIPDGGVTSCNFAVDSQNSLSADLPPATYNFHTLLEVTYSALGDVSDQANVDMSMVNGFNVAYKMYPAKPDGYFNNQLGYFTHNAALGSIAQAVDNFDISSPASQFAPESGLQSVCDSISSQMPGSFFAAGTSIVTPSSTFEVWNNSSQFVGCFSPFLMASTQTAYLSPTSQNLSEEYQCNAQYATLGTCTTAAQSPYVNTIHNDSNTIHGYAYPFDDWFADYGIDRHTSLVWEVNSFN